VALSTDAVLVPLICSVLIGNVTHVLRYDVQEGRLKLFFHEHFVRYITEEELEQVIEWWNPHLGQVRKSATVVGNV
jgi:hypothetical protein